MKYMTLCEPFDVSKGGKNNAAALIDLDFRVNEYLQNGWVPLGGVTCCITPYGQGFVAQALIKVV